MKGKWIFRHHAPLGDRCTSREMFFGVTNVRHPKGCLFTIEDGTWSSDGSDKFASSHDRGPMSLRAFKKYLRKHPELEQFGNVMSLCSRYRGLKADVVIRENSANMVSYDCHIDAIYVPIKQGFPEPHCSVRAFVRLDDCTYKHEKLYFECEETPKDFKLYSNSLEYLGEVLYWEYDSAKHYPQSQIAKLPSDRKWSFG